MADTTKAKAAAARVDTTELGSAGLKVYSGIIYEEYLRALQGRKAVEVYRRMSESDPTISACLFAFFLILRSVKWRTDPAENSGAKGDAEAEFVDSLFDDMSHSWQDFLSETLTMLTYGWHYAEIVLKRRVGPYEKDPAKRSKFTDGRIGIRKLAPRAQDTLWRWEFQDDGGIQGMHQWSPTSYKEVFVPIERALLFRTSSQKNNPEGKSILRAAYRPWHKMTVIEDAEGVGIERELAGLPVAYIPGRYLNANASSEDKAFAAAIQKMVRDVKFNEQAGVVLPSDPFRDSENNPSAMAQVKFELLSSGGARSIDTNVVVQRHQTAITRSMLADFLMLGQSKGAFNLGENKTEMFYRACEAVLEQIAAPINNFLIPRIWDYNGLDRALMPKRVPGRVAPVNLNEIGTYLAARAQAGDMIFPDPTLTEFLNEIAYMPPPSPETLERKPEDLLPPQLRPQGGGKGPGAAQVVKPADEKPPPDQEVEDTSGVRKFNPYHRPGGDEHGGEFTSSSGGRPFAGADIIGNINIREDMARSTDKNQDQPVKSLDELYDKARAEEPLFKKQVQDAADSVNGVVKWSPTLPDGTSLKSYESSVRKLSSELNGDPTKLRDILRATVLGKTVGDARRAAAKFIQDQGDKILRVKDRFTHSTSGYRDILVNYRTPNGLVAEVQFNGQNMFKAKMGEGHLIYEKTRMLKHTTLAHIMGPDYKGNLTSAYRELQKQQVVIYNKAYQEDGNGNWGKGQ